MDNKEKKQKEFKVVVYYSTTIEFLVSAENEEEAKLKGEELSDNASLDDYEWEHIKTDAELNT